MTDLKTQIAQVISGEPCPSKASVKVAERVEKLMGAVKNHFHEEICDRADFERTLEDVKCPFCGNDPRSVAWLAGFSAALEWAKELV